MGVNIISKIILSNLLNPIQFYCLLMMLYQLTSLLREQKSCKISNEIMSGKRERENKDLFGIGSESLSCEIIFCLQARSNNLVFITIPGWNRTAQHQPHPIFIVICVFSPDLIPHCS